ncbi:MAG TPA: 4-hydroxybenzoate octaprenyltransferase [Gammaproteobacteria bacterium]|nr:4-hydroxybenzoate octaprenyltransferase [Gammaproteobacteria bacterium]
MVDRLTQYALLMRMDRPIGTFLLLWPTLWALWLAGEGHPRPLVFTVFVLGVFLMRSAGCVINDFADRDFDPHVARTRHRPLATGRVSPREALVLFAVLALAAFGLVLTMNRLTVLLSFVAVVLAALYPFMKRFTFLPQPVLGAAFGWSIPMAYAAQTGTVPEVAWLLFIANITWATAYDTMYAMVDRSDDLKIGVKSTAILFGDQDRFIIGLLQATTLLTLFLVGRKLELGTAYYWGLVFAAGFAIWQQYLIRRRRPDACFRAFLNNNWFGMAVFVGIALHYTFAGA